jgi:hypothetical protein
MVIVAMAIFRKTVSGIQESGKIEEAERTLESCQASAEALP